MLSDSAMLASSAARIQIVEHATPERSAFLTLSWTTRFRHLNQDSDPNEKTFLVETKFSKSRRHDGRLPFRKNVRQAWNTNDRDRLHAVGIFRSAGFWG